MSLLLLEAKRDYCRGVDNVMGTRGYYWIIGRLLLEDLNFGNVESFNDMKTLGRNELYGWMESVFMKGYSAGRVLCRYQPCSNQSYKLLPLKYGLETHPLHFQIRYLLRGIH